MTNEEKERFIRRMYNDFEVYQLGEIPQEEQRIYGKWYSTIRSDEVADRKIAELNDEIHALTSVTDFQGYYQNLVDEYLILEDNGDFHEAMNGYEALGEYFQKVQENQKNHEKEFTKLTNAQNAKTPLVEELASLTRVLEEKSGPYQEKIAALEAEKQKALEEAERIQKRKSIPLKKDLERLQREIEGMKNDPDMLKEAELTAKLAELNQALEPYKNEADGRSIHDPEAVEIQNEIDNKTFELGNVQPKNDRKKANIRMMEGYRASYQDELDRKDDFTRLSKEAEEKYREGLEKCESEKKELEKAENNVKDCQDKLALVQKDIDDSSRAVADLEHERETLASQKTDLVKTIINIAVTEKRNTVTELTQYKPIRTKMDVTQPQANPVNNIKALAVVKEAYDSYYSSNSWFKRLFKNWANTAAGRDYAKYKEIRDEYIHITNVPKAEIDTYLDKNSYTGRLAEYKRETDAAAAQANNPADARVNQPVDVPEVNDNAAETNIGEAAPVVHNEEIHQERQ